MPNVLPDIFDMGGFPPTEATLLRRVLVTVRNELIYRRDLADVDGVCLALAQGLMTQFRESVTDEEELLHYAFARVTPSGWLPA